MRIDDTVSLINAFRGDVDMFHEREAKQPAELMGSIKEKPGEQYYITVPPQLHVYKKWCISYHDYAVSISTIIVTPTL